MTLKELIERRDACEARILDELLAFRGVDVHAEVAPYLRVLDVAVEVAAQAMKASGLTPIGDDGLFHQVWMEDFYDQIEHRAAAAMAVGRLDA